MLNVSSHKKVIAVMSLFCFLMLWDCFVVIVIACILLIEGCCLIHSISGELLHKLVPSNPWSCPHLISHSSEGLFIVHYADQKGCLAVFTCNGQQLCYKSLKEPALVSYITVRNFIGYSGQKLTVLWSY